MTWSDAKELSGVREAAPAGAVLIGMALVSWWPAFVLGAWGDLFFDQVLTVWAAATAAFVFVLLERRRIANKIGRAVVLLLPSVWLLLMFVLNDAVSSIWVFVLDLGAIVAVIVGTPFTLWTLVHVMWPDFGSRTSTSLKWAIVATVVGIAAVAFVLGLNQEHFLTCEDFAISGNSEPPGCVHSPPRAGLDG